LSNVAVATIPLVVNLSNVHLFNNNYFPLIANFSILVYNLLMRSYLSHFSAAKAWNIPYIESFLGNELKASGMNDVSVFNENSRFSINGKKAHSCTTPLPSGAVTVRSGMMVASPELLFLELANKLCIHKLILLGLQLCSHLPGQPSEAITTKQKLSAFLAKTNGHRGHRKAEHAVKYVEDGSASIMESIAYMILCLPHSLGGYGLNGAIFNHEIKIKGEAQNHLGQNRCFVDLYYKKERLAVEYESFAYHKCPSEQGKDLMRSEVLKKHGIEVLHLSTIQLYNSVACRNFAYNLATRLGKRMQIRAKKFDEMHDSLRALLPISKLSDPATLKDTFKDNLEAQ